MCKVRQVKVHTFGIPKYLQQYKNMGANEVGITVIIITLKYIKNIIPTSFVSTFSYYCKHFGFPKVCTFT